MWRRGQMTWCIFPASWDLGWFWPHVVMFIVESLSHVRLSATPWTVARQAPLYVGFSRQESWSGLPWCFSYWGSVLFRLYMSVWALLRGRAELRLWCLFWFALLILNSLWDGGHLTLNWERKITFFSFFFPWTSVGTDCKTPSCDLKHSTKTNLWHTWLQPASF